MPAAVGIGTPHRRRRRLRKPRAALDRRSRGVFGGGGGAARPGPPASPIPMTSVTSDMLVDHTCPTGRRSVGGFHEPRRSFAAGRRRKQLLRSGMAINIQTTGEQTVGLLRRTELRKFLTEPNLEEL